MNAGEDDAVKTSGGELRFLLDGELVTVRDVSPQTTLLEFLRERLGRTGTKEGCAEGDCGACTVVLGEPGGDGGLAWRPVNACIRLLPTIDGKALFTVESLKEESGALHPTQQALVDCHGSQCGFCTPGFAMSLFGLYKNSPLCNRAVIDDALSGNLCRCTGYRSIIAAAQRMVELPPATGWRGPGIDERGRRTVSAEERNIAVKLATLQRERALEYEFAGQRFFAPQGVEELARLRVAHPGALLVAGATDVGLWVTKQHRDLGTIIHTGAVRELLEMRTTATHLEIGAAVSLTEALALIDTEYPTLAEVWSRFASVPIRNSGTLGGNIANGSPIGDSMPVLLALGATLVLRRGAEQRELALDEFYLDYQRTALVPGEFVESIRVPRRDPASEVRAYKISRRFDQDISAVFACFFLRRASSLPDAPVDIIRIGCGGVAAIPARATRCEQALIGKSWDEAALSAGAVALESEFEPITDMRASAAYRRAVLANLLRRFLLETRGGVRTRALEYAMP
jgi:xanthine dehydrogenase small subunit